MTAGIFAAHGVWFGNCRPGSPANIKGFFENNRIKQEMIRRYGKLTMAKEVTRFEQNPICELQPDFRPAIEEIIRKEGYSGGPWAYKMSALYLPAWADFQPVTVGIRRQAVKAANIARNMMGDDSAERIQRMIDLHNAVIDTCDVIVNTDELIDGDYTTLEAAFDTCGLTFDPHIADDFIEPDQWHYTTSQTITT